MHENPPLRLHIGLPKTASTHLQRSVFPRLGHLDVRSMPTTTLFDTPADRRGGRRLMAACFSRSVEVWGQRGAEVFAELLGEAHPPAGPRTRGLLVSDEAIGRTGSRPHHLRDHLRALSAVASAHGFGGVQIVCVIRRQDRWLASHYAQIADRRPGASQADFEAMVEQTLDPAGDRFGFGMLLDFAALHRELAAAVGAAGVTVLPHEWLEETPDAFYAALFGALGVPAGEADTLRSGLAAESAREGADGRSNVKSSGVDRWTLARGPVLPAPLRRLLPGAVHRRVEWRLQRRARRGIELTPEVSARVLGAYAGSNRALAAALGLDLDALGYAPAG